MSIDVIISRKVSLSALEIVEHKLAMYHHNMTCVYYTIFFFVVVFMLHSQRTPTLAQCPYYPSSGTYIPNHNVSEIDRNVLEFALNLEFLEAEFFLWSGLGFGLDQVAPQLVMGGPSPVGGEIATLDEFTHNITVQLALQEVGHLRLVWKQEEYS